MLKLPPINWNSDNRFNKSEFYIAPLDDPDNRVNHFLGGWQDYLANPESMVSKLNWKNLGRIFASILGDIPEEQRRNLYAILLALYLKKPRKVDWSDEDRQQALEYFFEMETPE